MGYYTVNGKNRLMGEVNIQGSKNSAVAILMASLITDGETVLTNLPRISDVALCIKILRLLGCTVIYESPDSVRINTRHASYAPLPPEITSGMRASSYLIGALTARFGECALPTSGGCDFGQRPIDMHLDALKSLGACEADGLLKAEKGLVGTRIRFPQKTVGGTVNAVIAASKANGLTVIENAAREPHVKDLCAFLGKCGADIIGAGTDTVRIRGRRILHGSAHKIDGDMIETGTYICAALATHGAIRCTSAPSYELEAFFDVLGRIGADIDVDFDTVTVRSNKLLAVNASTAPYPYLATDLQPQLCALLGLAEGKSKITETVFEKRFGYLNELKRFGLNCRESGNTAEIIGINGYTPATVTATDLRGGAAAVICALNANGKSVIHGTELIERGYSDMPEKLRSLGAEVFKG